METQAPNPKADYLRNRGLTERSKALVLLLRETPYVTSRDVWRFFFPGHTSIFYARLTLRVLIRAGAVDKAMLGNGVFIYFLSEEGARYADFLMQEKPRFDAGTKSFYLRRAPRKASEALPYFLFPATALEFQRFTPKNFHSHPFDHTSALVQLTFLLRKTFRFLHVLWLDMVRHKERDLNIPFHPDLLLTNSLRSERGRVYIELENSRTHPKGLADKVNHLASLPAEAYLFLCTSRPLLQNLSRLIRHLLNVEGKGKTPTARFSTQARQALATKVWLGSWKPDPSEEGQPPPINDLSVFRYDAPELDPEGWASPRTTEENPYQAPSPNPSGKIRQPYSYRHPGPSSLRLGDFFNAYRDTFKAALNQAIAPSPNPKKQTPSQGESI